MRYSFVTLQKMAQRQNGILEREKPNYNNDFSRYSITYNHLGTTALCKNLIEVENELYSHIFEHQDFTTLVGL